MPTTEEAIAMVSRLSLGSGAKSSSSTTSSKQKPPSSVSWADSDDEAQAAPGELAPRSQDTDTLQAVASPPTQDVPAEAFAVDPSVQVIAQKQQQQLPPQRQHQQQRRQGGGGKRHGQAASSPTTQPHGARHQRHNGFPREDRHASDLACRTVIITGWDPDTAPEDEAAILSLFEHAGRHTTAWQGQRGAAGRSATLVYDKVAQAARARRLHRLASGLHAAFPPPCSGGGDGAAAAASPPESGRRTPVKQQQQAATPPTPPATPVPPPHADRPQQQQKPQQQQQQQQRAAAHTPQQRPQPRSAVAATPSPALQTPTARPGGSSRGGGNITVVSARGVTLDGCDESARRGAPRTLRDIEPLAIYVTGWSNVPSPRDRDRLLEPFTSQGAIVTWLPRSAPPPRQQQADGDGADGDGAAAPAAAAAAAWDSEPSQWPGGNGGGGGATAGGDGDAAARAEDADTEETAVVVFGARLHAARAAEARRLGDAGLRARALRDAPPALAAALRELPLRVPARPPLDTSVASRLIAASLGIRRATPPPPPGGGGPREDAAGDEGEGSSGGGGGGGGAA